MYEVSISNESRMYPLDCNHVFTYYYGSVLFISYFCPFLETFVQAFDKKGSKRILSIPMMCFIFKIEVHVAQGPRFFRSSERIRKYGFA